MSVPAHPDVPGSLRLALNWFHTWFGLFMGGLLFVMFWTGTLAVFDREIDRWTMPATRLSAPPPVPADTIYRVVEKDLTGARGWRILLPDARTPVAEVQFSHPDTGQGRLLVDPRTLERLPRQESFGGTRFFYPYHFRLNIGAIGLFLCAFAAIVMTALCISGVIIHHKIFADFFTLRIVRKPQRTTLDLHNLSGVLTLPFLLMISFTGVAIFTFTYLPTAQKILFARDPAAMEQGYFSRAAAGAPGGPSVSLDLLRDKAAAHWGVGRPKYVQMIHPGDANAYVELRPDSSRTLSKSTSAIWFDAASGAFLAASPDTATRRAYDVLYGIHLIQFDHWTMRWLYFISGLAGCVLIATGLLFWIQSRRKRHEKLGLRAGRLAEAMSIAVTTGLLIATIAFFIANRLLPADWPDRAVTETRIFHLCWLLALGHAFVRNGRAGWREQAWLIAAGCLATVVLNGMTTAQGLVPATMQGLWQVAGIDLAFLASAATAVYAAMKLSNGGKSSNAA